MAKTKKMFGGGMSSRMAAPRAPMGPMGQQANQKQMQFMSNMLRGKAMPGAMGQQAMQAKAPPGAITPQQITPAQAKLMETQRTTSNLSATPDAGAAKAYADMQAQKAGAGAGSQAAPMKKGGVTKMAKGGVTKMAESKKMVGKEIAFMKKKGAPKSMVKHEEAEMKTKKYAKGGMVAPSKMGAVRTASPSRDGIASKGKTKGTMVKMAGSTKGMKYGGKC
jgi:hypothetical protein